MERYIWLLNGKTFDEADPISLAYGEQVRITYVNETMMAHPMHLHGPHVQLETASRRSGCRPKHVVIIAAGPDRLGAADRRRGGRLGATLPSAEPMVSGMMAKVSIAQEAAP